MEIYDLILFAGQSNMAGRGIVTDKWPQKAPVLVKGAGYEYRAITAPDRLCPIEEPFGADENNPDGIFDHETTEAVTQVQKIAGIEPPNGEVDLLTWNEIVSLFRG